MTGVPKTDAVSDIPVPAVALTDFAAQLLIRSGLDADKAAVVAGVLVDGDLLGHVTHGLALLPGYLGALQDGTMAADASVRIIRDRGACAAWDGNRLPGPWLVSEGVKTGIDRARKYGSFTLAIQRSHHIACLAAYLRPATDKGMMLLIGSSDPAVASVAPYGGTRRMITPNPVAAGIPTSDRPILLDISMSTTTNAMVARTRDAGADLPHAWMLDASGRQTADPGVFFADPPGSILPLGGADLGYKGFGLGLLVEALTSGLGGHGRADPPEGWGASVYIQVMDPDAFGGRRDFLRQTDRLVELAKASPPAEGHEAVRLPGERGLQRRETQLRDGVDLALSVRQGLSEWARRLEVELPFKTP